MPRGKTFTGCWTCRARRVKCDEAQPTCKQCSSRRLECAGYGTRLHWLDPASVKSPTEWNHSERKILHSRRLLPFSRTPHLTDSQVNSLLYKIDVSGVHVQPRVCGPFGVFRSFTSHSDTGTNPEECGTSRQPVPDETRYASNSLSPTDDHGTNGVLIEFLCGISSATISCGDEERSTDLPSFELNQNVGAGTATTGSVLSTSQVTTPATDSPYSQTYLREIHNNHGDYPRFLTAEVKLLLKHYRAVAVSFFCIVDNDQTPWRVLHLPKAMQAACELELGETPGGASNILLHTILSISAFSLQNLSRRDSLERASKGWIALAIQYKSKAFTLLTAHLDSRISGMIESEYQEFLAAILSMVSIDVMCGDTTTSGLHLRACEALIRTCTNTPNFGLSSMSKALHMIFVYLRTMQTVAVISHMDVRIQRPSPSVLQSGLVEASTILTDDFLSKFLNLDECGDLSSKPFSCEMIYGFPISLLVLLYKTAAVIMRSSCRTDSSTSPDTNSSSPEDHHQLEEDILEWPVKNYVQKYQNSSISPGNFEILVHNTHAFHQAVILFFYDKVYRTRVRLLQPYVRSVLNHLEQIEKAKARYDILAGALLWPAYTAARNAMDIADRRRFISWFENSDKIGAATSEAAIDSLNSLWGDPNTLAQTQVHGSRSSRIQVLT